jgi:hypothetical protein
VTALRPGLIVELGTHNGVSFSSFCEAMQRSHIVGRCFAIDTWKGDEQTGFSRTYLVLFNLDMGLLPNLFAFTPPCCSYGQPRRTYITGIVPSAHGMGLRIQNQCLIDAMAANTSCEVIGGMTTFTGWPLRGGQTPSLTREPSSLCRISAGASGTL